MPHFLCLSVSFIPVNLDAFVTKIEFEDGVRSSSFSSFYYEPYYNFNMKLIFPLVLDFSNNKIL